MNPVQSGPAQMGGRTDRQLKMRKNMRTPLAYIIFFTLDMRPGRASANVVLHSGEQVLM